MIRSYERRKKEVEKDMERIGRLSVGNDGSARVEASDLLLLELTTRILALVWVKNCELKYILTLFL